MNLRGTRCIVTGASSGIGLEVVKELLNQGAIVLAVSRNISTEDIQLKHKNLYLYQCNVADVENIDTLFHYAINILGDIDLFCANAGFAYWGKEDVADWKRIENIFKVNVFSVIYSLEKMKELKKDNPFNFVITASGMSYISLPGYALYGATKGALKRFAESYYYELKENQILSLVYPISTKTNFFKHAKSQHIPFPCQSATTVARKVIKGIKKNKRHIYPSTLFRVSLVVFSIFPFFKRLYIHSQNKL